MVNWYMVNNKVTHNGEPATVRGYAEAGDYVKELFFLEIEYIIDRTITKLRKKQLKNVKRVKNGK